MKNFVPQTKAEAIEQYAKEALRRRNGYKPGSIGYQVGLVCIKKAKALKASA